MLSIIKKNKLLAGVLVIYLSLGIANSQLALKALRNSSYYLREMAMILPVIFMLTVAIDVLIKKEWIIKQLGENAGFKGALLALLFGSISAGPIYAAFPIAKMLHKKGASLGNVVIILSAWAVVKVPMLANEVKFLGPDFMVVRWFLTVAFIFAIAFVIEKTGIAIKEEDEDEATIIYVNSHYCVGCAACVRALPQLFVMVSGKVVYNEEVAVETLSENTKKALVAMTEKCPTKAIKIPTLLVSHQEL